MNDVHVGIVRPRGEVHAVAVILHGGRSRGYQPVRRRQLSVLRMVPFALRLATTGGRSGLAVWRVRYRVRGWNGAEASPVTDVAGVLDRIAVEHPGAPVAMVGHSMGGRVAINLAGHETVRAVVALAPWLTENEDVASLGGRHVLFMHGSHDRTTDARATAAFATRTAPVTASCGLVSVRGGGHTMVWRAALWHRLTTGFVLGALDLTPMPDDVRHVLRARCSPVQL